MEKGLFLVLRLRDGVLKSGMAGGCVGYRCVGGRQNIYISLFCSRETRCLFCLCYKLDFLFKNLFLTYFLSKIFIKYSIYVF